MKRLLNYIVIFIITFFILFSALVVSSKIPRSAIKNNLKESVSFYKKYSGIYMIKLKRVYSYIHYYADTRKLNIIYNIDSDKPLESTLWSKYYQRIKMDINKDFIDVVENDYSPNTQYLRYWNGVMLFLRPLLVFFNMEQIYMINQNVLAILLAVLFVLLYKNSKKLAFIFLTALFLTCSWYVPRCIEYSVMFYVMFIASIIAIKINNKNQEIKIINEKLYKLFLITGMMTSFFDFLTTELLTIFVPLIIIIVLRKEKDKLGSLKELFIFVIKSFVLWFIGYCGMWAAKWIVSSLVLNINALDYVKESVSQRINGLQGLHNKEELYGNVIGRNLYTIPIIGLIHTNFFKTRLKIELGILLVVLLLLIDWKELKNKKYLIIFVLFGIVPYIRYLILANHSYRHIMFTFRIQIITIMSLLYIIIDSLNYKLLFKELSKKKKDKKIKEQST